MTVQKRKEKGVVEVPVNPGSFCLRFHQPAGTGSGSTEVDHVVSSSFHCLTLHTVGVINMFSSVIVPTVLFNFLPM